MSRVLISLAVLILLCGVSVNALAQRKPARKPAPPAAPAEQQPPEQTGEVIGPRIIFVDGVTLDVDDSWKHDGTVWYRLRGVSRSVDREVKKIENRYKETSKSDSSSARPATKTTVVDVKPKVQSVAPPEVVTWIYLKDGARLRVDEVREVADGAWYNRHNVAIFIDRERISRIEKELPPAPGEEWKVHGWTSGNAGVDQLIKSNGARFGVDPYLVFLVIEQESHFHPRALSPKGARGLMQLMPGTARRLGVSKPFDPAENIRGGTQYLKELLTMFNNKVDLALASYNAGEGRVLGYGNRVPPFRETQDYVRRISSRYRNHKVDEKPTAKTATTSKRN